MAMQTISSLPKDFFENVTLHPLDHRAGKFNISTDDYFVFGCEDKFRGVKKAFDEGKPPFYLLHEETFDATKRIFYELYGLKPDLLTEFHDDAKTWNAFIVSHSQFVRYEEEVTLQPQFNRPNPIRDHRMESFVNFPLIGGFNSYGFDKNPAFFCLVGTPFRKSSGSLLTLDNFRFTKDDQKLPFVVGNRSDALTRLVRRVATNFSDARTEFDALLMSMATRQVSETEFAPVVLDLYNRNRNPQSIRNDDRLRHRVKRLYMNAANSVKRHQIVPWTEFIHFIVRYNQFYFNKALLMESVDELFSRKESYLKFDRLFRQFLNDPDAFTRYVNGQVGDWERIEDIVMNMPS